VFDSRVLKRICGPKRQEVGDWRIQHSEQRHNVYASPNIIRGINSRKIRWAGHIERMVHMRNAYELMVGSLKGRDHSKNLGIDATIILERILGK
jgi:hypothetical protein